MLLASCRAISPQGSAVKESWTVGQDDPAQLPPIAKDQVHRFSELSFFGAVPRGRFVGDSFELRFAENQPHALWNSSYWPLYRGGVAVRWQRSVSEKASDSLSAFEPGRTLSDAELSELNSRSPIEKYDIVSGQFDFASTKRELARRPTSGSMQ